jgi:hypothetical protein
MREDAEACEACGERRKARVPRVPILQNTLQMISPIYENSFLRNRQREEGDLNPRAQRALDVCAPFERRTKIAIQRLTGLGHPRTSASSQLSGNLSNRFWSGRAVYRDRITQTLLQNRLGEKSLSHGLQRITKTHPPTRRKPVRFRYETHLYGIGLSGCAQKASSA